MLGTLFVAACGIILFFLLKQKYEKTSISLALSCLLTMIISSFMWALGLVQGRFIVLLLVITALTTVWAIFER